jgi:hypothetical protein
LTTTQSRGRTAPRAEPAFALFARDFDAPLDNVIVLDDAEEEAAPRTALPSSRAEAAGSEGGSVATLLMAAVAISKAVSVSGWIKGTSVSARRAKFHRAMTGWLAKA